MKNKDKITELQSLLLEEDRVRIDDIDESLNNVRDDLNTRAKLEGKVNPIIETRLEHFQKEIPLKMGPAITEALKRQVSESQHEVVDALHPLIGKLIKKYIRREIELISERIDKQFESAFSLEGWKRRLKAWFSGTKESKLMMRDAMPPELNELFLIKKGTGLLVSSYSWTNRIDADMIAGMLTAIKSFSEDAMEREDEELEAIVYESYKIQIYNVKSFYVAVVLSGVLTAEFKAQLHDKVMEFAELYMTNKSNKDENHKLLTEDLKNYFDANPL